MELQVIKQKEDRSLHQSPFSLSKSIIHILEELVLE